MNSKTLHRMVFTGMMAAFVFVATYFLKIHIPTPAGPTMLKTGNILCLLGGLLFGPVCGGLAAGIGSGLYDLTDPAFASGAWLTFLFFFAMGFLSGLISHAGGANGENMRRNTVAVVVAALSYVFLYLAKSTIVLMMAGSAFGPALLANGTKAVTSLTNAVIAVIGSLALVRPIQAALRGRIQI